MLAHTLIVTKSMVLLCLGYLLRVLSCHQLSLNLKQFLCTSSPVCELTTPEDNAAASLSSGVGKGRSVEERRRAEEQASRLGRNEGTMSITPGKSE